MYLSLDELQGIANKNNLSQDDYFVELIRQHTMTSQEVLKRLEISKQRLFSLKKEGRLVEIKKGLFFRKSVERMRYEQFENNQMKHRNKENSYELTPAYKVIQHKNNYPILLINELRFGDCLAMVRHKSTNPLYAQHLSGLLKTVTDVYKKAGRVYMLKHEGFDYVENTEELFEAEIVIQPNDILEIYPEYKGLTVKRFYEYITSTARILGIDMVPNYNDTLVELRDLL